MPCACDGVSPESCVSLEAMSCEDSSLGICTSSGVRPNLVNDFLRHVFIHTMLIPVYRPRLSSNPFWGPFRTFTTATPFNRNQCSFSPRTSHCPLVIFRPHPSPLFGHLLFGLGPATLPFHHTYLEYLHATNAMEHVLLAFVRWQDAPSNELSGSPSGRPQRCISLRTHAAQILYLG